MKQLSHQNILQDNSIPRDEKKYTECSDCSAFDAKLTNETYLSKDSRKEN